MEMVTIPLYPVPKPRVVISRSYSGTVYAGTELTLTAAISPTSTNGVDVGVAVEVTWTRGNDVIGNSSNTAVSAVSGSDSIYTASLSFSPITTANGGAITATVRISPTSPSPYIQTSTASYSDMLAVQGMYVVYCAVNSLFLFLILSPASSECDCIGSE